jgi:hypothetical protein
MPTLQNIPFTLVDGLPADLQSSITQIFEPSGNGQESSDNQLFFPSFESNAITAFLNYASKAYSADGNPVSMALVVQGLLQRLRDDTEVFGQAAENLSSMLEVFIHQICQSEVEGRDMPKCMDEIMQTLQVFSKNLPEGNLQKLCEPLIKKLRERNGGLPNGHVCNDLELRYVIDAVAKSIKEPMLPHDRVVVHGMLCTLIEAFHDRTSRYGLAKGDGLDTILSALRKLVFTLDDLDPNDRFDALNTLHRNVFPSEKKPLFSYFLWEEYAIGTLAMGLGALEPTQRDEYQKTLLKETERIEIKQPRLKAADRITAKEARWDEEDRSLAKASRKRAQEYVENWRKFRQKYMNTKPDVTDIDRDMTRFMANLKGSLPKNLTPNNSKGKSLIQYLNDLRAQSARLLIPQLTRKR